jgi:hypothetical protein
MTMTAQEETSAFFAASPRVIALADLGSAT